MGEGAAYNRVAEAVLNALERALDAGTYRKKRSRFQYSHETRPSYQARLRTNMTTIAEKGVACCAGREFRIIVVVPDELEESPFTMPIHYFTRRTLLQDAPLGGIFSAYSPLFRVFACKARYAVLPRHAWGNNKDRCKIPSYIVFARTRTDDGELPLDLCLRTRVRCDKSDFLAPFYDTRRPFSKTGSGQTLSRECGS